MNILAFKEKFKDFVAFNLSDIRKIEAAFDLRRLNEWQAKGYIKMLRRGHYVFSGLEINDPVLFLLANKIYAPSYVSLEMALAYYNLIPEAVYGITSVASRKTNYFKTDFGEFIYRHIKPQLMFGYKLIGYQGKIFKLAEPEKAVLDFFYLNTHIEAKEDFEGLRFNSEEFVENSDKNKFKDYLSAFENKKLAQRVNTFLRYIHYD
jgi:predicted transcriptional regulator of viral defense system